MKPRLAGILAILIASFLISETLKAAPCPASATVMCLAGQRFAVEVRWKDFQGNTGQGQAVGLTPDTGYFWFFTDNNVELVVKVLDARAFNNKFWVFFGALSNVEYTLTVTDTVTGATKSYQNPSGQFASVGDTAAFPGATIGVAATHETAAAGGTSTSPESLEAMKRFIHAAAPAPFTPCLGASSSLGLSNCRFLLRVSWRDSLGRTGEGHAVQLTNDTGYFWFFTDNNVELIVKVLDARAFNGNFWVFFGALSNVEYKLTVTDLLTKEVKTYANPAGRFASVGDTNAFTAGTSVVAVKDDTRAVSAEIDGTGGTLTATDSDGSVFTLKIPADALVFPTPITMTPLDRVDGFPFPGGARAGVQLEPEGLFLWEPATLSIQSATAPPDPVARVTFGYRGQGDEFIVVPGKQSVGGVRLQLSHFSGYGEGFTVTQKDLEGKTFCEVVKIIAAARAKTVTSRHFDSYIQRMFPLSIAQKCGEISEEEFSAQAESIWQEAFDNVVYPALEGLKDTCEPSAFEPVIELAFEYIHVVDLEITDAAFTALKKEIIYAKVKEIALKCIDQAYKTCKSQYDPSQVRVILGISRSLQKAQLIDDAEFASIWEKVDKCLRFEVSFDTLMTVAATVAGGQGSVTTVEQFRLKAQVPVRLESIGRYILSGDAPVNFAMLEGSISVPGCTITYTSTPGTFQVDRMGFDYLNFNSGSGYHFLINAEIFYRPGNPQRQPTLHCEAGNAALLNGGLFQGAYKGLHFDEFAGDDANPSYAFLQWEPILNGPLLGRKEYSRSKRLGGDDVNEQTTFLLKHTPE